MSSRMYVDIGINPIQATILIESIYWIYFGKYSIKVFYSGMNYIFDLNKAGMKLLKDKIMRNTNHYYYSSAKWDCLLVLDNLIFLLEDKEDKKGTYLT